MFKPCKNLGCDFKMTVIKIYSFELCVIYDCLAFCWRRVVSIGVPVNWVQAEAQQLEMATLRKFGAGIGAPTRPEQVREAADIHIKLGNVQRYCELMIELGQVPRLSIVDLLNLKCAIC